MIILEFIVAMFASISFAILFTAPKKEVVFCGLTGALGWAVYYGMTKSGHPPCTRIFGRNVLFNRTRSLLCCGTKKPCNRISFTWYLSTDAWSGYLLYRLLFVYWKYRNVWGERSRNSRNRRSHRIRNHLRIWNSTETVSQTVNSQNGFKRRKLTH